MDKEKLIQVIADQQDLRFKPSDLPRQLEFSADREIVVISGIRRCGKSTLLHEIRNKNTEFSYYLNFDDERLLDFKVDDFQVLYELFIELYGKQSTFYFDEIQNVIGWERFVRRLYDYGNKIYITGSNASMLSKELGTHLTGRYIPLELFPFSFEEYLQFKKVNYSQQYSRSTEGKSIIKANFNNYFSEGGFPAYLKSSNKQYLKSLYESILYRDVMVRNGLTREKELVELVYFLASNVSKLASYNSLAKVIGVKNATTVSNYLNYLQNTYLLFLVNKYDPSLKKQTQNPKKIYFIDVGLVKELGFHHSADNGRLLENLVFIELKRRRKDVYYHNQNKECDFVIKEKTKITEAIQVSWSVYEDITKQREIEGLVDAMQSYGLREGLILTNSEEDTIVLNEFNIRIRPVWKWLLDL
jgi:predicted AAA+ superfamily ATPase